MRIRKPGPKSSNPLDENIARGEQSSNFMILEIKKMCSPTQVVSVFVRPTDNAIDNSLKIKQYRIPGIQYWDIFYLTADWFSLKLVSTNSTYKIFHNGVEVLRAVRSDTKTFSNLEVWLSGPNQSPAMGNYRNFLLESC